VRCRNYKYFAFQALILVGAGLVLTVGGCSEDPQSAESRQVRQETTRALETVGRGSDSETLQSARNKVQSSLVKNREAGAGTKDAAYLASGNLALAHGRTKQFDLDLKILPVRRAIRKLEETLRSAENLMLEQERIQGLLDSDLEEMNHLGKLVNGAAGLKEQLEIVQAKLDELQAQQDQRLAQQEQTQAVLDDYQSRSDDLLRQAELTSGEERLALQKQAYAILMDRKDDYIEAQALEDAVESLDVQIALAQSQADSLEGSITRVQARISEIETSPTRTAIGQQLREIGQTLSVRQQQLAADAKAIVDELAVFKDAAQDVSSIFEEALSEFEKVRSRGAAFIASLQLAESYHRSAAAHAAVFSLQLDTSERLNDMINTAEPVFADILRESLSHVLSVDPAQSERVIALYDQAIEAYEKALAGAAGQDAKSSVLKSELLAVDSKMRLADRAGLPEVAEQADMKRQELMEQGQEYGVSFTQSETRKLVEFGINYTPSLPVNLEVLAEELEIRFSAWKRLPLAEQEPAVEANLVQITELIDRYGETLATRLGPLRQEMLAARERGYEAPPVGGGGNGFGEPNSL
jgi:tetratricopeptide (TPR) repeat protein